MKKTLILILVVVMAAALFAGCSGSQEPAAPDATAATEAPVEPAAEPEPAAPAEPATDGITVGFSLSTLNNAFFVAMRDGIVQGCEEQGVTLIQTNADNDIALQTSQMEDLILQEVDALIVTPIDSDAIVTAEQKAVEAGIPVIYCDRRSNGDGYTAIIETDNVAMGALGADKVAEFLTAKYGEPAGKVVEIEGLVGTSAANDRGKGFNDKLASDYPNIEVVARQPGDFNQETSLNVMQNIIQAQPEIDAVYGHNDDCTLGALKAIEGAGLLVAPGEEGHIYIIGIDGIADALTAIRDGGIDATISQDPIGMGIKAVELAVQVKQGQEIDREQNQPFYLIDASTVDEPTNWANSAG
jgi:ribose transport system substrate-binding protein